MTKYVEVSINLAQIDGSYDYSVPPELEESLEPGCLVVVPFNKQIVQGVVLSVIPEPSVAETLDVISLVSDDTILTPHQLELAKWLSIATVAPMGACVRLMIPAGLSQHADVMVELNQEVEIPINLPPIQKRLLKLLQERGSLRGAQLEHAIPKVDWRASLDKLRKAGLVRTRNVLPPPRIAPKSVRAAQLSIPPEAIDNLKPDLLGRGNASNRRREILNTLAREAFPIDFSWIYAQTGSTYADIKFLAEKGLLHVNETEVWRDPLEEIVPLPSVPPILTADQQAVWNQLQPILGQSQIPPVLLHGVTGSGKTEIYLRAVDEMLAHGKQALILVPEIAMTPQAVRRFMSRYPNQIGLFHSKLSDGENYDTWRRARQGELKIIIGSRSALFVPLPALGLIVLDECDHESYDETERLPYYHAVETAEAYTRICSANLILGSATPRVTQYFKANKGDWRLFKLPRRVLAHREAIQQQAAALHLELLPSTACEPLLSFDLPPVEIVDMRQELKEGNTSVLSRALFKGITQVLEAHQQAILFLNRKGSATYVFCRNCGEPLRCPNDGQPLVYYDSRQALLCNLDGYSRKMPVKCPNCGSPQIRQLGLGTERLEALVKETFPAARILRWDAETTTAKGAHDLILSHFSAHRADILIGTQMLAKGLDLPLVTLVGIVLAETGLNLPDYRSAERSFQVLAQVSGRAGRSPLGGKVVLQTYQPDNYVIQAVAGHDFESFYHQELARRKELAYPPYTRLVRLEYRHLSEEKCQLEAQTLAAILGEEIERLGKHQTSLIGPVPCYYRRQFGLYRWQIILRGPDPLDLLTGLPLRNWLVEVDPPNLL